MPTAQAADDSGSASNPVPQSSGEGEADAVPLLTAEIHLSEPLLTRVRMNSDDCVCRLDADWLAERTQEAARCAGIVSGSIDVQITDDDEMTRLHEHYLGVSGTTDVITFDLSDHDLGARDGAETEAVCTQIIVCVDVAHRESLERHADLNHEVLLYIVHGLLHCIGYDDHEPDRHDAMHRREDEILQQIGVGHVYRQPSVVDEMTSNTHPAGDE